MRRYKHPHDDMAFSLSQLRKKVESAENDKLSDRAPPTNETERLLHELQVHQIELEMQNDELRQTQLTLDAARLRYFDLYDLAPVGYLTVSIKGLITETNLTAANLLGVNKYSLENQPLTNFILPDNQDVYYHYRKELFSTGLPQQCELQLCKKDGTHLWARFNASLAREAGGNPLGRIVLTDITERKKAQDSATAARLDADAAHQSKNQFFANMSHELRTPMNAIMGMTDLVLMTDLNEMQRINLNYVKSGARRLLTLISDLLDISKMEAGKMLFAKRPFSIQELVQEHVHVCKLILNDKPVTMNYLIPKELPKIVIGDPLRLQQIISNLLNNAVKFTDAGTILLTIEKVCGDEASVTLRFLVSDSGIGIEEEKLGLLFKNYSQLNEKITRKYGGSGLGLAISKMLAEQMGGEIGVQSQHGRGSTFYFTAVFGLPESAHSVKNVSPQNHGISAF